MDQLIRLFHLVLVVGVEGEYWPELLTGALPELLNTNLNVEKTFISPGQNKSFLDIRHSILYSTFIFRYLQIYLDIFR